MSLTPVSGFPSEMERPVSDMKKPFTAIALLTLIALGARTAAPADVVEVRAGDDKRLQLIGKILEETWDKGITIERAVGDTTEKRTVPLDIVLKVQRGELPADLSLGMQKIRTQQYTEAVKLLRDAYTAANKDGGTKWAVPYALFHAGEAASYDAKYVRVLPEDKEKSYGSSEKAYGILINNHPMHRFVPEAVLGRAIALMWLKRYPEAKTLFETINTTAYPERTKAAGRVWQGRLLVEEGQLAKAIPLLQQARRDLMAKHPDLAYRAVLGEAYALQKKDTLEDRRAAEELFETVGLRSPVEEDRAEACNSRGISLKGRGDRREALLSFLRVVVLHSGIRHEHERALYEAAKLSKEVYGNDTRAKEHQKTLQTIYPQSYWAQKLAKEL